MHYRAGASRSAEPGVTDVAHDRDGVALIPPVVAHEKVKHVLVAARDALLHGVTEAGEHPLGGGGTRGARRFIPFRSSTLTTAMPSASIAINEDFPSAMIA